ncbi:MAG: nitroreductase family protein [Oscillospiraceae bacterium]|nr:nitroreductase family protein [Oscillospiraceae bacterium]
MDFTKVITERFSCKKYSDTPIEKSILDEILQAGRVAPTAKNLQEQKIYVVQTQEKLDIIDSVTPCRYGAPVVLVVAYDKNTVFTYPGEKMNSGMEDAAIVATHLMLAACNAGVDSCWLNFFNPDDLKMKLGLPEHEEILMLLDLGYAESDAGPLPNHFSRKDIAETVKYL